MESHKKDFTLNDNDRPLLIINDFTIAGSTRFQKYGFLLHKEYGAYIISLSERCNIKFYDDWKPYHFGPFSKSLKEDLKECVDTRVIQTINVSTGNEGRMMTTYSLTPKGRTKWVEIWDKVPEIPSIVKQIQSLQKIPYYILLGQIYRAYPEFTTKSKIRDEVAANTD